MGRAGNCSVSCEVDRTLLESAEIVVKSPFCYEMFTFPSYPINLKKLQVKRKCSASKTEENI